MPLPSDETTPPVTKMYLVVLDAVGHACSSCGAGQCASARRRSSGVSTPGWAGLVEPRHADAQAVLQRPELLQPLRRSSGVGGERGPPAQRAPGVGVDAEVLPVEIARRRLAASRRNGIAAREK